MAASNQSPIHPNSLSFLLTVEGIHGFMGAAMERRNTRLLIAAGRRLKQDSHAINVKTITAATLLWDISQSDTNKCDVRIVLNSVRPRSFLNSRYSGLIIICPECYPLIPLNI